MKRLGTLALTMSVVAAVLVPAAASAGSVGDAVAATNHTPAQIAASFDLALLPGLAPIGDPPAITGDPQLDARIRSIAEARGYQRRAEPNRPLVNVGGRFLQPEAAAGWESLRAAAAAVGIPISITSGYRPVDTQIGFLVQRLGNRSDAAIDRALSTVAAPGYSKHHTGYAIDMRSGPYEGFAFKDSAAYAWLAADNFANAKAHGWLPSYPEGSALVGPRPEPWEFVWVGPTNIICGDFQPSPGHPFCDAIGSTFEGDIEWLLSNGITTGCHDARYCTDDHLTRAQAATMMWRLSGLPVASTTTDPFDDVPPNAYYTQPVHWMTDNAITTGVTATEFLPLRPTTRAEFVTFLWRMAGRPSAVSPIPFDDVDPHGWSADAIAWASETGITHGTSATMFSPDALTTRGQAAAFLHRFSRSSGIG